MPTLGDVVGGAVPYNAAGSGREIPRRDVGGAVPYNAAGGGCGISQRDVGGAVPYNAAGSGRKIPRRDVGGAVPYNAAGGGCKIPLFFLAKLWYNEKNIEKRGGGKMQITVLAENTAARDGLVAEHGLSLLVETNGQAILCDGGQSDALLSNAAALGKDLSAVSAAVLSHGHYDHSGGISALAKTYPQIPIFLRAEAGGDYFHGERTIGIDKTLATCPQCRQVADVGVTKLGETLSVFSGFGNAFPRPSANEGLTVRDERGERADDFCHEQAAVIEENGNRVLISGCAHSGILNILARFTALYGGVPDAVFSGFHTAKPDSYTPAEIAELQALAEALFETGATLYTGHCTGDEALDVMKPILGDRLVRMRCGDSFQL